MDPEIEAMLTFTATSWLIAVICLAGVAVRKMYVLAGMASIVHGERLWSGFQTLLRRLLQVRRYLS